MGLALGMALKHCISAAKGLKLNVTKLFRVIPMFVEITGEKVVGQPFWPHILNRVKVYGIMLVHFREKSM